MRFRPPRAVTLPSVTGDAKEPFLSESCAVKIFPAIIVVESLTEKEKVKELPAQTERLSKAALTELLK